MASVKVFRVHPKFGVSTKELQAWINRVESELGIIAVTMQVIPAYAESDPRLVVVATRVDDMGPIVK